MNRVRRMAVLAMAVVGTAACSGCRPAASRVDPAAESPLSGHARMVELLGKQKEASLAVSPLFGDADLKEVEWSLENLPLPPDERFEASYVAGLAAKRLGRMQQAVEHLQRARELYARMSPAARDRNPGIQQRLLVHLAGACLRLGEQQNCIACQTGDSCIFPIRAGGVHENKEGSQLAIQYINELLTNEPRNATGKWLLNLAHMTLGTYPDGVPAEHRIPLDRFAAEADFPRFPNTAIQAGLNTVSLSGGVVVEDFDGDGWLDLMVSDWGHAGPLRLYRNRQDGTFELRIAEAGLEGLYGGLNLIQADYDNDGDVDVLVLRGAWLGMQGTPYNSLLQNDGQGRFRDVTFDCGLAEPPRPTQTGAWADYDNDGDLDLFVGNESLPSQLFQNDGQGHFRDVADWAGVANLRYSKGVAWGDYNHDGYPDLYVSNYGEPTSGDRDQAARQFVSQTGQPNRLYRNNRDGTFTDVAEELGVTGPRLSFPVWFWDFNNDGALDLLVASYDGTVEDVARDALGETVQVEHLCLYQGDGQGGFQEVSELQGLAGLNLTMGASFGDLDNDGFLDVFLGTGHPDYEALMPNRMYHNQRGTAFLDVTTRGGFGLLQKGHGIAFADLDNDGDQDVFAEVGGAFPGDTAPNALLQNPGFGNHWITLRLTGTRSNRSAIGARVKLTFEDAGQTRSVYRWVGYGSSFGGNPLRQEIGLGQATRIRQLEIHWPTSGQTQLLEDVPVDQFLDVREPEAPINTPPASPTSPANETPPAAGDAT